MKTDPSRTAMLSATARAGHLLTYGPGALLQDWLAWPLLGADADSYLEVARGLIGEPAVDYATWHAGRSRLTEDWLAASGARQYVILGAGLDSFAWRQPDAIEVYEFDHPATQGWKRARLEKLGIIQPRRLTMIEADFERVSVSDALEASSVDLGQAPFVSWLGVLPYLTQDAIVATLAGLPHSYAAISYVLPERSWDESARSFAGRMLEAFAEIGEPVLTLTTPSEAAALLERGGFRVEEDLGADDVAARFGLPCISHERAVLARKSD